MTWCTWQGLKNKLRRIRSSLKASASFSHCCRARTLRILTNHHHQNPPEPRQASSPEQSGTSPGICLPEPHQVSSPEPSGISPGICTGTLRNLTRYLHQVIWSGTLQNLTRCLHQASAPEASGTSLEPGVETAPDRTGATLG
jgi:hypothetical protein